MKLFECPCCDGDGGISDDPWTPSWPCDYCHRKGWVLPVKRWWWFFMGTGVYYKLTKPFHRSKP